MEFFHKLNKKNYFKLNLVRNLYLKNKYIKTNKIFKIGNNYKVTIELIENQKKRLYSFQGLLIKIKKQFNLIESLTFQLLFDNIIATYNIPTQIIKKLSINGNIIYK